MPRAVGGPLNCSLFVRRLRRKPVGGRVRVLACARVVLRVDQVVDAVANGAENFGNTAAEGEEMVANRFGAEDFRFVQQPGQFFGGDFFVGRVSNDVFHLRTPFEN